MSCFPFPNFSKNYFPYLPIHKIFSPSVCVSLSLYLPSSLPLSLSHINKIKNTQKQKGKIVRARDDE